MEIDNLKFFLGLSVYIYMYKTGEGNDNPLQ